MDEEWTSDQDNIFLATITLIYGWTLFKEIVQ